MQINSSHPGLKAYLQLKRITRRSPIICSTCTRISSRTDHAAHRSENVGIQSGSPDRPTHRRRSHPTSRYKTRVIAVTVTAAKTRQRLGQQSTKHDLACGRAHGLAGLDNAAINLTQCGFDQAGKKRRGANHQRRNRAGHPQGGSDQQHGERDHHDQQNHEHRAQHIHDKGQRAVQQRLRQQLARPCRNGKMPAASPAIVNSSEPPSMVSVSSETGRFRSSQY